MLPGFLAGSGGQVEVAFVNLFGEGKYVPVAWLVSWLPVLFVMPCGECPSPEAKRASKSRTKNSPDQFPKLVRGIGRERGESHRNESMTEVSDPFSFPPFLKFTFDHATTTPSSGHPFLTSYHYHLLLAPNQQSSFDTRSPHQYDRSGPLHS